MAIFFTNIKKKNGCSSFNEDLTGGIRHQNRMKFKSRKNDYFYIQFEINGFLCADHGSSRKAKTLKK